MIDPSPPRAPWQRLTLPAKAGIEVEARPGANVWVAVRWRRSGALVWTPGLPPGLELRGGRVRPARTRSWWRRLLGR